MHVGQNRSCESSIVFLPLDIGKVQACGPPTAARGKPWGRAFPFCRSSWRPQQPSCAAPHPAEHPGKQVLWPLSLVSNRRLHAVFAHLHMQDFAACPVARAGAALSCCLYNADSVLQRGTSTGCLPVLKAKRTKCETQSPGILGC